MARVTVEDCVLRVPNRFELVALAAQRARDIAAGSALTVDRDRDKNPVVALREIAEKTVGLDELNEAIIRSHQRHVEPEYAEEEELEPLAQITAGDSAGEAPADDLDLESLARELQAQAGEFRDREES